MKAFRLLSFLILMGGILITGCSKSELTSEAPPLELNEAEQFVQRNIESWNGSVSEEFFLTYAANQVTFPEELLRYCLTPGTPIDTSQRARVDRLSKLTEYLNTRDASNVEIESIIQVNQNRRIIDASPASVALVIANMGSTVSPQTSYDYLNSSLNRITTGDLFLANWALQNTNVPGNFIASDDDYLELVEGSLTLSTMYSGQNYTVEALVIYNGPGLNWSYFNTISAQTESVTIAPGELLAYGPDLPLGELILNPTLENEEFTGGVLTDFIDARIVGPIPGGQWFTIQNGSLNDYL